MGPCFAKVPLKKGCQLIATIDMMFSTIGLVALIWTIIGHGVLNEFYECLKKDQDAIDPRVVSILFHLLGYFDKAIISMSISTIFFFVLSLLLYIGSIQESIVKLMIWVGINFILMILSIFTYSILLIVILVIYKLYSICWVVMSLVDEFQAQDTQNVNNGQHGVVLNPLEVQV